MTDDHTELEEILANLRVAEISGRVSVAHEGRIKAKTALTQYIQQRERLAILNEYEYIHKTLRPGMSANEVVESLADRLAALKHSQEGK